MSLVAVLLLAALWPLGAAPQVHDPGINVFDFTRPSYNLSISEKWDLNSTAWASDHVRVGVHVPEGYGNVKFKIVQGDGASTFKASSQRVGDFAFLIISLKPDQILNRELQDEYDLVIKASSRKKTEANFEAQCEVKIRVLDDNDIFPFFRDQEYHAEVDAKFPVNGKLVQLQAVDADVGLNGELLYSIQQPSEFFYVEPSTGWIRSYKPLVPGTFEFNCQVEDRASRLFANSNDKSAPMFNNAVPVTIKVRPATISPPKLSSTPFPLKFYHKGLQKAALLTISDAKARLELSTEVLQRGDSTLQRVSSTQYLLYIANVTKSEPEAVSLILRDVSMENNVFTAENISLEMDGGSRRVWFDGASEEDTPRLRLKISEAALLNEVVHVFRARTNYIEDQHYIKYRIHGKENAKLPFSLEKNTGILRLKQSLSNTAQELYEFSVVAKLDGIEEKAFVDVFVSVKDTNNNCPKFLNIPDKFKIYLNSTKTDTVIYRPQVQDDDKEENALVTFKIGGVNGSDKFLDVDPKHGTVRLTQTLPPNASDFEFSLLALDHGEPLVLYTSLRLQVVLNSRTKMSPLAASIALTDSCSAPNSSPPEFVGEKAFDISVDTPVGLVIGKVRARDADQGLNGLLRYTTNDPYIGVDPNSGELTVLRPLDLLFDSKNEVQTYDATVEAWDSALKDRKSATAKVHINIAGRNLHAPEFEKTTYFVRVSEELVPDDELVRLRAVDRDPGAAGRVEYRLAVDTDLVSVDPDSGAFRLERPLDRELRPLVVFPVLAVDRGSPPRFSFANVTILLEDVNDNAPRCLREVHEARIHEDIPNGTLITCLGATDPDSGRNAKLRFDLEAGTLPFRVDENSGCLFTVLQKPLDFDEKNVYEFRVKVSDHGESPKSTSCLVRINVTDVNENQLPPIFSSAIYEASVFENEEDPKVLTRLRAVDPEGTSVKYRLIDGSGLGHFSVDRTTGEISSMHALDAERESSYWLVVVAEDSSRQPLSAVAHVFIKVLDRNDHVPVFDSPVYYAHVMETSEPNKVVLRLNATDGDISMNTVTYELERGNPQSNFHMDANTGYLMTGKRHLDRETQPSHDLYIRACDNGKPQQCSTALVIVKVDDRNDNAPKFRQTAANLKVPAGKIGYLARVFADDADEDGPNSLLTYKLEGNTDKRISIDDFGRIYTAEPLNPDTTISLTVSASDQGVPRLRNDISVVMTAVPPTHKEASANSKPSFRSPEKWRHLYASDRDTVGTVLGRVEVDDADDDLLWFSIDELTNNPNETFAFHGTDGELVLARRVNLIDQSLKTVEMKILVSDGHEQITETVYVHVTRSVTQRPVFDNAEVELALRDDFPVGYIVQQVHAEFDSINSGLSHIQHVSYGIHSVDNVVASDSIKIDSATGSLVLEKPFSSAAAQQFSITVSAKVDGGLENFAVVKVSRIPSNQHAPECTENPFEFVFPLNQSVPIGRVIAFDLDEDLDGQLSYKIGSDHEQFKVDEESGDLLFVGETVPDSANVVVKVSDRSTNISKSTECAVIVRSAYLPRPLVVKKIPSLTIRTDVDTIAPSTALLADGDGFLTYGRDSCPLVDVMFGSGAVLQDEFVPSDDNRLSQNCSVFVENGVEKAMLKISLSRADKSSQLFELRRIDGFVLENAPHGSPVFEDSNRTKPLIVLKGVPGLKYRILSPQERSFGVDINHGNLKVLQAVDYDAHKTWSFIVSAETKEGEVLPLHEVVVHIQNVNNKPPKFEEFLPVSVLLPARKDTIVGQIRASDPDGDVVKFAVWTQPSQPNPIAIDRDSGILKIAEDVKTINGNKVTIKIMATDGQHTAHKEIDIMFTQRNDQLRCEQHYSVVAPENYTSEVPKLLLSVAWPEDAKTAEVFDFSLITDTNGTFSLDRKSGLLFLNPSTPLDRELTQEVALTLKITSGSNPERWCQVEVIVNVEDINDCPPHFVHLPYEVWLSEDAKVGDRILTVKAKDEDTGAFGTVRYSLDTDAPSFVEVNKLDGKIRLKKRPSGSQLQIGTAHEFHVIAHDQGNPPFSARAPVVVHISNRHQPVFSHTRYTTRISESSATGTTIFGVQAKSNTNGTIAYVIDGGDPQRQFNIDFLKGLISVNAPLDRESRAEYELRILAIDLSRPGINSTAFVKVNVDDVNDSPPKFEQDVYEFSVVEGTQIGALLGQVRAVDPDAVPADNKLVYSLSNGPKEVVMIDAASGLIYLNKRLDFEKHHSFDWVVVAKDADGFAGDALLRLNVIDENDNEPLFVDPSPLHLELTALNATEQFIHHFHVTDLDELDAKPGHVFKLVAGDETLFRIDSNTGVLKRVRQFDPTELQQFDVGKPLHYSINISVTDRLFFSYLKAEITFNPTSEAIRPLRFNSLTSKVSQNERSIVSNRTALSTLKVVGGSIPYRFSSLASRLPFYINESSGTVHLTRRLDHESSQKFVVPLLVRDARENLAAHKLEVKVEDDNDNGPIFIVPEDGYEVYLSTSALEGDRISKVMAVDADNLDKLEYNFFDASSSVLKHLALNPNQGYLVLKSGENIEDLSFSVTVSDRHNPPHQQKVPFRLRVVDGPVPQFSRLQYFFAISEDAQPGKVIGELMVGAGGPEKVTYEIPSMAHDSEPLFNVDKQTGKLVLTAVLDREKRSQHYLIVRVTDHSGRGSHAFVVINVVDINDNPPVFINDFSKIDIREDTRIGSVVYAFHATDDDDGLNAKISYELLNPGPFRVDKEQGWLVVDQALDRERVDHYELKIRAVDEGGLSANSSLRVNVLDVNDNPPKFDQTSYSISVDRDALKVGARLANFKVIDPDTANVQNITIDVVSGFSGLLEVSGRSVILKRRVPDGVDRVEAKLVAFDGLHSVDVPFELKVLGHSSKKHCLDSNSSVTLNATNVERDIIQTFDGDDKDFIRVNHLVNAERLPFEMMNNTKLILKSGFGERAKYDLKVRSKVRVKHLNETSVCLRDIRVNVEPSNRTPPKFQLKNYTIHQAENTPASEEKMVFLERLEAVDPDFGIFGLLRFKLILEEKSYVGQYFYLDDRTGALMLKKTLDRENAELYNFRVQVEDGGADVLVVVDDVNDNEPRFEKEIYQLKVLENEAVDYELLKLVAHDPDGNDENLIYTLIDDGAAQYVKLDKKTGVLKLLKSFDYEEIQRLRFHVQVTDGLLNSKALVDIEILDENDNSPRFEKTLYEVSAKEGLKAGSKVVQVKAVDADSEHFGKVSYSLHGEDASAFMISDDGWIKSTDVLDYEVKKLYRLNVKAVDGGTPALSDDCLVTVVVEDVNDHPPHFEDCNMTAVIQEGVQAGQALLRVVLSDPDSEKNAGPFRAEVRGDGASAFTFDSDMNLITTRQLSYNEKKSFQLTVHAFDVGGLSSSCPLTVFVKQQSRHPPVVHSHLFSINTLLGEFVGGDLGRVEATDKDPADMLRFAVVESDKSKNAELSVDPTTGQLTALSSFLPGVHRFNVSVTDGKYTVYAPVTVDVTNIDQEALDHSVSITLGAVTASEFVGQHLQRFTSALARVLNVPSTHVRLISVQDVTANKREKRQVQAVVATPPATEAEVELLLTVLRGEARGYHRPAYVKQRITESIAALTAETGFEVTQLASEVCRRDTCVRGECRDRIWLDNIDVHRLEDAHHDAAHFFPRFQRTFECICRQGFAGRRCDVAVNQCSREDVCSRFEMCVPNDAEPTGVECVCAPGLRGDRCAQATCPKPVECSQTEPISLLGNGYFQLYLSQPLEQRMDLHFEFKTASRNAVLMFGAGLRDFHVVELADGILTYTWDCGSGSARLQIPQKKVDDGHWHHVRVVRRRRHVQMSLDNSNQVAGTSPGSSDVLNLFNNAMVLTFGARVEQETARDTYFLADKPATVGRPPQTASDLSLKVSNGTIGCIGRVGIDGVDIAKGEQGLRMFNARIGCNAEVMGPCLNAPCLNSGQCVPKKDATNSYSCTCPQRYTGVNCEIDLNACASQPCPKGIPCHNLYNDFHCSCPSGFTGKTCQMHGDWDPCITKPCGPYGRCERKDASFVCRCADGFDGIFCSQKVPGILPDSLKPGTPTFYALLAVFVAAAVLALLLVLICRHHNKHAPPAYHKEKKKSKSGTDSNGSALPHADNPANPLIQVTPSLAPPVFRNGTDRVPPRPPRSLRANVNGLPTVEVRPMPSVSRSNASTPPAPPKHRNLYDTAADLAVEKKPQPPPHRTPSKAASAAQEDEPAKRPPAPAHKPKPDAQLYDNPNEEADT